MHLKLSRVIAISLLFFYKTYTADNNRPFLRNAFMPLILSLTGVEYTQSVTQVTDKILDQHSKVHGARIAQADEKKSAERKHG